MLSREDFVKVILSGTAETEAQFKERFSQEIETFIDTISNTYKLFREFESGSDKDYRKAYTSAFLFNAIKNITESFTIFLFGFQPAAGNLMRHFFESIAMAMLLSNKDINVFEEYHKDPSRFPVHKSLTYVSRHVNNGKFRIVNKEAWNKFAEMEKFYDKYSHASALALSHVFHFATKGSIVIGGDFDEDRIEHYRKEIKRYISGAAALKNAIEGISQEIS